MFNEDEITDLWMKAIDSSKGISIATAIENGEERLLTKGEAFKLVQDLNVYKKNFRDMVNGDKELDSEIKMFDNMMVKKPRVAGGGWVVDIVHRPRIGKVSEL